MSFVVINALTVPEDRRAELEARFADRAGDVEGSPGFEAFELLRPVGEGRYLVYTRWQSREDFEAWKASHAFASGHRPQGAEAPVATGSEVWYLETAQAEYA